jgi:antitoxin (DNA-binding transcriptional repressor) of toxin-antitoxin stability system
MRTITVDEAQSELPKVLDEVEAGAEAIIARGEKPIARLVGIAGSSGRRPKVLHDLGAAEFDDGEEHQVSHQYSNGSILP